MVYESDERYMQYSRKKKYKCAYCKAIRKGSLSIAIHEKFEHNIDNKYFSDLEKYGSPTFPFHNSFKRNPMIKYEYQFKESNLGVIPFYSH